MERKRKIFLFSSVGTLTSKTHNKVKENLFNMVKGTHVPHAMLLAGHEGSLALSLALRFITYLHCTNRKPSSPCMSCTACLKLQKYSHPDVHHVFPIGPTKKIQNKDVLTIHFLQEWYAFLQKHNDHVLQDWCAHLGHEPKNVQIGKQQVHAIRNILSKKPFESSCKTILVWLPEHMHPAAANALLKSVEEPTPQTFFVFVSARLHDLLPTLRSRLCTIFIPPLGDVEMDDFLKKKYPTCDDTRRSEVINIVQGNLNLAEKMLTLTEVSYFEHFVTWARQMYMQRFGALFDLAQTFSQYPTQVQKNWICYALQMLRRVLLLQCHVGKKYNPGEQEISFCNKLSKTTSAESVEAIIAQLFYLYRMLLRNANPKLTFVNVSLRVAEIFSSAMHPA